MKKIIIFLALLLTLSLFVFPAAAEPTLPRLIDEADLLTREEYASLLARLDEISERQACDIIIVTVESLGGVDSYTYADDLYDSSGFGCGESADGILLLIDMERREWTFSIAGKAMAIFTEARQADIIDRIIDDLGSGAYGDAFHDYADLCDKYITEGIPAYSHYPDVDYGYDYDVDYDTGSSFSFGSILIALGIGLLGGFLYTASLKAQLKSVAPAASAENYTKKDSFYLTDSRDVFLYRNVSRRPRQQNNGGGASRSSGGGVRMGSSGRSHSGSRGRF